MRTKFKSFLTLVLVFMMQLTFAQEKTVTGTVSDKSGPLPGVTVIIQGTKIGAQTDFDGNYSIKAKPGDVLLFSFVGMQTTNKTVGASNLIDVTMQESAEALDEVVIVGYGTTTKQSFTGSVKTIKSDDILNKSVSNVSQALAGEVSGVTVINTSGQPGTSSTIRIRGFGSVNGNRDPLYVLDGVPFTGSLNSINPEDIASTTVLKDATATAIYGSRGANGVILITTKKGKADTSYIEVNTKTGVNISLIPRYSVIKSPEQYIGLSWEALYNKGVALGNADPVNYANTTLFTGGINAKYNMWNVTDGSQLIDPTTHMVKSGVTRKYSPENWEDYGFQNSFRSEANLTMSGGSEKTRYYTSFGYLDDIGYIINSNFRRYSTRINLSSDVKKWLTVNANMSYAISETNDNGQSSDSGSIFWFVDNLPPIFPLYLRDATGAIVPDPIFGGNQYDYGIGRGFGALTNSIADAHFDRSRYNRNEVNTNYGFNIKFTSDLTLETNFGLQYYNNKYNNLGNPFYGGSAGQGGSIYKWNSQLLTYNFLTLLRYKKDFGNHNLEVLVAHETNSWENKIETASKSKAVVPGIDDLNNFVIVSSPPTSYTDKVRLESYFGQINYNYLGKYFFSGSVRRDGTSRFIGANKWDNFGSAGLSWVISKESFMQDVSFIDFLKYKISYGLIGEQSGVGFYPAYNTFDVSNLNDQISISPRDIGNPNLTWETSKMFQTGVEFGIKNRISASVDYYIKNTSNLLFDRRVGPSVGYALITVNDGVLRNSGLEFDVTAHVVKKTDYTFDISLNGAFQQNTLLKMPIDPATTEPKLLDIQGLYGRAEGHSIFDFYTREWAGVDPADGTAMWKMNYYDANGNGAYDSGEQISSLFEYQKANPTNAISETLTKNYALATQRFVGKSAIPKVRGGFRLSGTVKNFDISVQCIYGLGGYSYDGAYATLMNNVTNGGNNWSTDILNRWQQPGDITNVPRLSSGYDVNVISASTRFLTRADFLSLNNVKIGVMESMNIFISGDNLLLLTTRDGFNPSTSETGASDTYTYSPLSTFTFGVRVKF